MVISDARSMWNIQKNLRIRLFILALIGQLLASCGVKTESSPQSIFDNLEIDFLSGDQISDHAKTMVQVTQFNNPNQSPIQVCSGIFISRNHLLTAAHCSDGLISLNPWNTLPPGQRGQYTIINAQGQIYGEYIGQVDRRSSEISERKLLFNNLVFKSDSVGFAVYYVSNDILLKTYDGDYNLGQRFNWINLSRLKPFQHQSDVLLHYPWGMPLAESPCRTIEVTTPFWLAHDCDAVGGSSGGLIVDKTNQAPIGMHLAGPGQNSYSHYRYQGTHESPEIFAKRRGCQASSYSGLIDPICLREKGLNTALPFTKIKDTIGSENPWLWEQIAEASRKSSQNP